ncbi:Ddt domain-containing protein ddr4 [Thalictrum thalictroides]|uniref:Ddt domain-containing protein ddr4 n=1 Tax=Thalictrum thalictroides TaxID=46969 RepID=A0A7J6V3Y4_THATH|nr:Ddt domain-containing protein ddr4 [Thalictrum thalictroides]
MSRDSSASLETPKERSSQEDHNNNKNEEEREEEEREENGRRRKYNKLKKNNNHITSNYVERKERLRRACTTRSSSSRLYSSSSVTPTTTVDRSKKNSIKKEKIKEEEEGGDEEKIQQSPQCSKIITPLVDLPPPPSLLPRWNLRSMWELASVLNFLNVFRPLLKINVEFSAEELETALLTPNSTLDDIHIPLLKAIPPVTRMALGPATWVTVLCRKLRDWWHWVADGEIPIVASHGTETELYKELDPGTRVLILKALCDIRVEQEDIRNYIDGNIKHGMQLSVFRKERSGGNSHGISYWYEDDPVVGHRLYREIRKVEVKKMKTKGIPSLPSVTCQWETVATNFDEFQDVSEKLFASKNRTEASLGKKLKIDMLPEIEKIHKRKEKLIKKQHREAILLDNFITADGLSTGGRSLRDRKPVTYTFDDYDRSINEAIKVTKRRASSPELVVRKDFNEKPEPSANGRWNGPSSTPQNLSYDLPSPRSTDDEETDAGHKPGPLDRSNRRRQRPQRYSVKEFVEAVSDNDADFDSDDDIVGEAVYDEEYLRSRKLRKISSSSEGDEEYHWDEENAEDEEEEEEEEEASLSSSEDTDEPQRYKKLPNNTRRGAKLRSVGEIQSGLRRSKRATHNRINYRQYEFSESEADSMKPEISYSSEKCSDASNNVEYSTGSQDSHLNEKEMDVEQPVQDCNDTGNQEQKQSPEKTNNSDQGAEVVGRRHFLDLNELAPGTGFDDGPD